jgi:hypothetical protein
VNEYLFRFPKDMPRFDYQSLSDYLGDQRKRSVGTTVEIRRLPSITPDSVDPDPAILVYLYDFLIADISPGWVGFLPQGDDGHMATTQWVAMIARHNGIAQDAGRRRRRKSDGDGPWTARGTAGVLVLRGRVHPRGPGRVTESKVVKHSYPVNLDARNITLAWYELPKDEIAARREALDGVLDSTVGNPVSGPAEQP